MPTASSDVCDSVDEAQFAKAIKAHNHDLSVVAESIGMDLNSALWYFYHRYRPCRQWDSEDDQNAFHRAMIDFNGNIKKVAERIGKRFDSCLWFYYCKYRHLDFYKAYKQAEEETRNHDDWCAICDDGGELMCCSACPKAYHVSCLFLDSLPEGVWTCPKCKEEGNVSNAPACGTPNHICHHCKKRFETSSELSTHLKFCRAIPRSNDGEGGVVAPVLAPLTAGNGDAPCTTSASASAAAAATAATATDPCARLELAATSETASATISQADGGRPSESNSNPSN